MGWREVNQYRTDVLCLLSLRDWCVVFTVPTLLMCVRMTIYVYYEYDYIIHDIVQLIHPRGVLVSCLT